jgi:hypothetical protein
MNQPNMKQASITHTVRSNPFDADIHNRFDADIHDWFDADIHNPFDADIHNPFDADFHNPLDADIHNPFDADIHNPFDADIHNADSYSQQQVARMYSLINKSTTGGAHVGCLLAAGIVFKVFFSSFYRNFSISNVAEHHPGVSDTYCEIPTTSELRFRRSLGLLQKPAYTNII